MGAITDLFKSERGLLAVAILIAATVLCGTHQLTVDQWTAFVQWVFGIYVAGKTVTGATAMFTFKDPSANQRLDQAMALLTSYLGPKVGQESPGAAGTAAPRNDMHTNAPVVTSGTTAESTAPPAASGTARTQEPLAAAGTATTTKTVPAQPTPPGA